MMKLNWKRLGLIAGLSLTLAAAGCGSDEGGSDSVSKDVDYKITGIEPGAGVFQASEKALDEYGLDGWEVQASSSGAMATALGEAISNEEPIIVTGWSPHWKFSKYDLKYLDDPKGVFGEEETIGTMVREGLETEAPGAYTVLDQFAWESDDIESVMLEIQNGTDPAEAAQAWVDENEDAVAEWTDGAEEGNGDEIELAYVEWDTEIASTNVVKLALESIGYEVTITPLDNAVMWQAVANGEADGMVAAWLPGTHGELYEEYKDKLVDLGPNLEGAKIGLVVPSYMDIDSIEDLEAK
ncbi:glycine/betaine ABC transporter [Ornithinibacillus gellani]|uniref:glycine betaine ABC transporter substrate-binding protein n=1 Tax=Ornithinibacillus gellani TaxID=2293253 RepID=UPI000F49920B|nr:glycine betaine ABC transporter substrate-binding protein [Ornithinibacillus gellani]TQS76607.1 glycine/betaine ABC transporter [Ornithinibacillus gellani]